MKTERQILCEAIDRMGWPEIHAFHAELKKGQSVYEDAGGYMMRCIGRLFGVAPREEIVTYQQAVKAMLASAPQPPEKE